MFRKILPQLFLALLASFCLQSHAHEYSPGVHKWKIRGGTLILVSGVVTNGMALYAHSYNFYIQRDNDKDWYQIPLLDKDRPGEYELGLTTKAKDERMVRDVRLEIRNDGIYLLRARATREDNFEESPITLSKYRFMAGDGEDWPYFFTLVSSKTYPAKRDMGVDSVLKQEAKRIQ